MREKITVYLQYCVVLSFIVLSSCTPQPEDVVKKYLDYTYLDSEGTKAYKLLSAEDKFYVTEEEFTADLKKKNVLKEHVLKKAGSKFNYKIISSQTNGDTTKVRVRLTKPNAENIFDDIFSYAIIAALSSNDEYKKETASKKFNELLYNSEENITEEKEFIVIKEKKRYRLYLNLGLPYKKEKIRQQVKKYKENAIRLEKNLKFKEALVIYENINKLEPTVDTERKTKELKYRIANTLNLGETKQFGNLEFTPERIEFRPVNLMRMNWYKGAPVNEVSAKKYLVLTFKASNTSKVQKFCYGDKNKYNNENLIRDNIGNILNEIGPSYDIHQVEDNDFRKLGPGETGNYKVVCEAPVEMATDFIWEIELFTDNQQNKEKVFISFKREDFEKNIKMAKK